MAPHARKHIVHLLCVFAFIAPVFCAATPAGAGDKDPAGLAGCYDLEGVDTSELPYTGTLCATVLTDLLYKLTWTLLEEDEGHVVYDGLGIAEGNELFAVWSENGKEYECYLHLFDIDATDGSLHGLRVNVSGATSSQTATRDGTGAPTDWRGAGRLAGSYRLDGSDEYAGKLLTLADLPTDDEDAYTFRWSGDTDLEGVGVRDGSSIVVVANPVGQRGGTCGSITFTRNQENRDLVGTFYTMDSLTGVTPRRRGEETATPRE